MMASARPSESGFRKFIRSFHFRRTWPNYVMLLIPAFFVILFSYVPLYGLIIAFEDYNPGKGFLGSDWVGLKWFRMAMQMPDFPKIVRNTVVIALGKMIFTQLFAVLFALLINEVRNPLFKRTVQTVTYFPHFLSWVIIGGVFIDMLSTKGMINQAIKALGGRPIFFLGSNQWFQPVMVMLEVWKEFGYGAIIFMAALAGVSPELYEAADIDGATRWKKVVHITLPGIATTVVLVATLNLANILNAGFDQVYNMYSPIVYESGDIIDTYVYRMSFINAQYSVATAIGLLKSVVSFVMITISYFAANKFTDYRLF